MATLRALRALDMRGVIPGDGAMAGGGTAIVDGAWRTDFSGVFHETASGLGGVLTGFAQKHAGRVVFEATGVERAAATSLGIAATGDSDRFLAYTLSGADRVIGSTRDDYLIGFGGNDSLGGGHGDDRLFGGAGRDTLSGGDGDDFLAGGEGTDLLSGGDGDDTCLVNQRTDRVIERRGGGVDSILSSVSLRLPDHVERLVLIGEDAVCGIGSAGSDVIDGNEAGNRLEGLAGHDRLDGDGGADLLDGGGGNDFLRGGRGADTFRFRTAVEADGDRIADLGDGADRIDLSDIDATPRRGDQAFGWIGADGFSGHAGELRFAGGRILGDTDGDGRADFSIQLLDGADVGRGDLIL